MKSSREATELYQFFAIKSDLAAAMRDEIPSIIKFHLGELVAMYTHTDSDRLRRAAGKAIAEHEIITAAANA